MAVVSVDKEFEQLLIFLRDHRGFDFTGYKRTSLMRRVQTRMQLVGITDFGTYRELLEVEPDEFGHLFNTILINVTSFFRDPAAWDFLRAEVLPKIAAQRGPGDPIRVWSIGCASGEEAYSLAIAIAETIGEEDYKTNVKLYATDIDEEALTSARAASYSARDLEAVPPEFVVKYFDRINDRYVVRNDFRRALIFGRNDLARDAPISHIDLLVCRNTLMYFNAETQTRIINHFHFALRDEGYLFLGKSEMLLTRTALFTPLDLKSRIFTKVPLAPRDRAPSFTPEQDGVEPTLFEAAFDTVRAAEVVIDATGDLAMANHAARVLFTLRDEDMGRPFQDLDFSYRPLELRGPMEQSRRDGRSVAIADVEWPTAAGERRTFEVAVVPLVGRGSAVLGTAIRFSDVTAQAQLQAELRDSKQQLETAYEELQSTVEELETTNEELHSTNEELETTNEELQATNEELETMNEELQSVNEELETMNTELHRRGMGLNRANASLNAILSSVNLAVAVLDRSLCIELWNRPSEELWGLRADEVRGEHFLSLDIGLPVGSLRKPLNEVVESGVASGSIALDCTDRRGRALVCNVECLPLVAGPDGADGGVIVIVEPVRDGSRDGKR
jgi:two-component system CheB/CheR fusion protein